MTTGKALDGTVGTIVFGNGTPALQGEIAHTGEDDFLVVNGKPVGATAPSDYVVPFGNILYVRIDAHKGHDQ